MDVSTIEAFSTSVHTALADEGSSWLMNYGMDIVSLVISVGLFILGICKSETMDDIKKEDIYEKLAIASKLAIVSMVLSIISFSFFVSISFEYLMNYGPHFLNSDKETKSVVNLIETCTHNSCDFSSYERVEFISGSQDTGTSYMVKSAGEHNGKPYVYMTSPDGKTIVGVPVLDFARGDVYVTDDGSHNILKHDFENSHPIP